MKTHPTASLSNESPQPSPPTSDSANTAGFAARFAAGDQTQASAGDGHARTDESAFTLHVIQAVAEAANEREAVANLVTSLSQVLPECTIRCALGGRELKCIYDLRLGWLGEESPIRREAAEAWNAASESPSESSPPESEDSNPWCLEINPPSGLGRCVIWMGRHSHQTDASVLSAPAWLDHAAITLRHLIWSRQASWFRRAMNWVAGTGWNARFCFSVATLLVFCFALWPVSYRVPCSAVVGPSESRFVSAPFAATLLHAKTQPGDPVVAGQTLLVLDGRPLRLELESIKAQIDQARKEHDIALAAGRIAEAQQAKLKQRELGRRADLILDRLDHLRVTSPIDGVVIAGDLHQSIGSPLETGQSLFEIAPLQQMIIELEIPEHEIGYVAQDAETKIRLPALGNKPFHATLSQVFPAATVREDRNVFIGRVTLRNPDGELRPGMRGQAIAYGPVRPWLWSHLRGPWESTLWWVGY